jgi:hypothetical protein
LSPLEFKSLNLMLEAPIESPKMEKRNTKFSDLGCLCSLQKKVAKAQ